MWQAVATETSVLTAPLLLPVLKGVEDNVFGRLAAAVQRGSGDPSRLSGHVSGRRAPQQDHITSVTKVDPNHTSKQTL